MSMIRKFVGQTVTYGLGNILPRIVYFLICGPLLTYLTNEKTEEFGTYSWFYAFIAVLIPLFSFRLDTALFRYGNKNEDLDKSFDSAFTVIIAVAIAVVTLGTLFSQSIADMIGFSDRPHLVMWTSWILALDILCLVPFAKLRLTEKAKQFALYKVFNTALSSVLILFFFYLYPKYSETAFSFIPQRSDIIDWVFIANIIASTALLISLAPVWSSYRYKLDTQLLAKMWRYCLPLVILSVANGVIQYLGVPLQKELLTEDSLGQAGIYEFTRRIASLFVIFTSAFNYAAEPFFFNNSSQEDRRNLYGKICRLFSLVGGTLILAMVFSIDIIKYLGGENFRSSIDLLPVLLIGYFFLGLYYNFSIWYKLSDKTWYGATIALIGSAVTIFISIVFLPIIGYAASAWAIFLSYLVMIILGYYLGQKHYPIYYPIKKLTRDILLLIGFIVVFAIVRQIMGGVVAICSGVCLGLVWLYYAWTQERDTWKGIIARD